MGGVSWELVLALLGAWIIVFLAVVKGIHSAGKVFHSQDPACFEEKFLLVEGTWPLFQCNRVSKG